MKSATKNLICGIGLLFAYTVLVQAFVPLFAPSPAAAQSCVPKTTSAARVMLQVDRGNVDVINSLDVADLRARMRQGYSAFQGWHTVGLTTAELTFAIRVSISAAPNNAGFCGWVTAVDASLGFDVIDVFVASRYRPGSCQFQTIKRHEDRHVGVFRTALDHHASDFRNALRQATLSLGAVQKATANQAADHLKRLLTKRMRPIFQRIDNDIDRANASIDTRETYENDMARCSSW